jgi:hypothetical protein
MSAQGMKRPIFNPPVVKAGIPCPCKPALESGCYSLPSNTGFGPFAHRVARAMFLLSLLITVACETETPQSQNSTVLAKVYNKTLYLSDLEGIIQEGMSKEDSAKVVQDFVRNWIRETVFLVEAEQNIPRELNIDKLVEDYKASLIKLNYETTVLDLMIDTSITQEELLAYYEANRKEFQLELPVIRCLFIKAPANAPGLRQVKDDWEADRLDRLREWSNKNAQVQRLEPADWYRVDDLAESMPESFLQEGKIKNRLDFVRSVAGYVYFFRVLELVPRNKTAPLGYAEGGIRKMMLFKKKAQLLENLKDTLYQEAMEKKQITVYE